MGDGKQKGHHREEGHLAPNHVASESVDRVVSFIITSGRNNVNILFANGSSQ